MPKIIREKYDNGVLVERQTEGSNTTPWHWLMLVVHTVIAICLVALVVIAVHDSLALRAITVRGRCVASQLRTAAVSVVGPGYPCSNSSSPR